MSLIFCTFATAKVCATERMKLSVIILSYAIDEEVYRMNCRAIESLFVSEEWELTNEGINELTNEREISNLQSPISKSSLDVLLIESNREAKYTYDSRVRVLVPEEKFGFHRFFNIGLDNTSGEFVAFCNNDIVFTPGWWSAIMKVKEQHPKFMCFSPVDSSYPMMAEEMARGQEYVIGWENKRHFAAWCFVWERKVFKTIGRFDERYDFYSADGDELLTLRKYAVPNVLVTGSEVKHLSQVVTKKMDSLKSAVIPLEIREKYPLTDEEIRRGLAWLWEDVRFYEAYQKDKMKWGHWRMVKRVNHFFERHPRLHVRPLAMLLYNRHVNVLLTKLLRLKW